METYNPTKKRIAEYLEKGKRFDGRKPLEHRPISVELGVSKNAEGSAEVRFGKTIVRAGVKMGIVKPYPDSEDSGALMVTVEMLPLSSERFKTGPPSVGAVELGRIIDRGIRESEMIDIKKLCIKKGEEVWSVMIDIYIINDDGGLIDASAFASIIALRSAFIPEVKDGKVQFGHLSKKQLPLSKSTPLTTTFYKMRENFLLDPTTREEDSSDTRVSLALSEDDKGKAVINAVQKGGSNKTLESPLTQDLLFKMIDSSVEEQKKLRKILGEVLKKKK